MFRWIWKKTSFFLTAALAVSLSSSLFSGDKMPAKRQYRWFLGASASPSWSVLPESLTVDNGGPMPYQNDVYSLQQKLKSALALNLGREWRRVDRWFPKYTLELQYERFLLGTINGTITQYSLPQFLNYSYEWNTHADVLSINTHITLTEYGKLSPFFSFGLGWAMNRSSRFHEAAYPDVTPRFSPAFANHTENKIAYSLGVGVDYEVAPQWSTSLAYKYQYLNSLRSSNGQDTWANQNLSIKDYKVNMLVIGVAYHFN